jgi:hypothetical protein
VAVALELDQLLVLVGLVAVEMGLFRQQVTLEPQILVVVVAVRVSHPLLVAQAALASSFSNGPKTYKSQIPLHLPVHG